MYPTELQLNKANSSDTETSCLDLNLSITNGIVSSKIYDKRYDFDFEIVNFPFLDGDVPRSPSYGVYISQLIRSKAVVLLLLTFCLLLLPLWEYVIVLCFVVRYFMSVLVLQSS